MTEPAQHKFETLDAMRGCAAIAVMLFHYQTTILAGLPRGLLFGSGYLAVDLFFVLSGFVIAFAYDRRLAGGMGILAFARVRLIRLLPMIWLGTLLGASYMLGWLGRPAGEIAWASVLHAAVIPSPSPVSPDVFPMNGAAWSLFWELIANFLFALCFMWLSLRVLAVVAALAVPFLLVAAYLYGALNGGSTFADLWVGFPRVVLGFAVGVILCRTRAHWRDRLPALPSWVVLVATLVVLEMPAPAGGRAIYGLLVVCIAGPALVAFGSSATPPARTRAGAALLAEISYPLYAIHVPLMLWVTALANAHHGPVPITALAAAAIVATVPLSYAVARWYDLPLRRRLTAAFAGRRRVAHA